jgi:acyl-CoA synthetase (AMP-forming)/AMP-acid ligase II
MNLAGLLDHAATCFADRPAVTWRGETVSYDEFQRQVAALDGWLRSRGAGRDTCVAVFMDNRREYLVAMFAVFRCRVTLAGYKVPRRWVSVDSLPCNAYGKVLKRELREELALQG